MPVPLKTIVRGLLGPALLAAAACSPGERSSNEAEKQENGAESASAAETAAAMPSAAKPAGTAPAARTAAAGAQNGERRCGWLSNPTPANWWLTDRDGEWILAAQGGEQAPGMDEMPDMSSAGWVETNGHYGYGCACMTITHDPATRRVTRIADAEPRPLSQCRSDRRLPRRD